VIRAAVPMLARCCHGSGIPDRNRGTIGGSIANADPSAEIPLVAVTLSADIVLSSADGARSIAADDFSWNHGDRASSRRMRQCGPVSGLVAQARRVGFFEISARRSILHLSRLPRRSRLMKRALHRCSAGLGGVGDRPLRLDVSSLVATD